MRTPTLVLGGAELQREEVGGTNRGRGWVSHRRLQGVEKAGKSIRIMKTRVVASWGGHSVQALTAPLNPGKHGFLNVSALVVRDH